MKGKESAQGETRSPENPTMYSGEIAVDRISQLPDSLLVHILSFMPTDETLVTSALSKSWRYLWYSLDTFSFSTFDYHEELVSYVDYVLDHSVSPIIKKFQLDTHDPNAYKSDINRWLSFAVEKKVENVKLRSYSDDFCAIPECLCACSSLMKLVLGFCYFDANMVIAWKSLKNLKLKRMVLSDDQIVSLLSGCPALETLELWYLRGFNHLDIRSSGLETLKLVECGDDKGIDRSLEISAPSLKHLDISGRLHGLECRLVDVSSLVSAKLTFDITCIKYIHLFVEEIDDEEGGCHDYHQGFCILVQDYLQKLSCASKITIGTCFVEALCMLQLKGMPIPELKCKYLTLELHSEKFSVYGAASLLRASPHVETLNIDIAAVIPAAAFFCSGLQDLVNEDNIDLQSWISSFVFFNLKNVKIAISSRICLMDHLTWPYAKNLYELSAFLLKNASVLEKFVIITNRRRCETCSMNCTYKYLFPLAEKLLGSPRLSANAMIIFQE